MPRSQGLHQASLCTQARLTKDGSILQARTGRTQLHICTNFCPGVKWLCNVKDLRDLMISVQCSNNLLCRCGAGMGSSRC